MQGIIIQSLSQRVPLGVTLCKYVSFVNQESIETTFSYSNATTQKGHYLWHKFLKIIQLGMDIQQAQKRFAHIFAISQRIVT